MISVIIPNYNRRELLLKAIKSCKSQTYQPAEIIVVDDSSDFNVETYLKDNLPDDFNCGMLKLYVNEKHFGAAKSRNFGVKKSIGNYVCFLDSDDYWEPTKLYKQIEKFTKNQNLDLVYCDQYLLVDLIKKKSKKKMINSNILYELINGWTAPNTSTLMFRKKSFERLGGFDERLKSCQDHDLWFRVAYFNLNVDYIDQPLSYFTSNAEDRISYNVENRMSGVKVFLGNIRKFFTEEKYFLFRKEYIYRTCIPLLIKKVQMKKYVCAFKIYFKYLMFNDYFYKRLVKKIFF